MNTNVKPRLPSDLQLSVAASALLDLIRGAAAFLVMVGHLRALFYVNYTQVAHSSIFVKIFYFVTSFGIQAVLIFFVLSGFFISSSIFRMHNQGKWSWREYLIQRMTRLWIVLLPALFLTAFWDLAGISLFGPSIYEGIPDDGHILSFSVIDRLDIFIFVGNIFFLQEILTPPFGSNGALWSLSYEFWYYMAFPCLFASLNSPRMKAMIYIIVLLAMGAFVGVSIASSFAIWMLGVFIIFLPKLWHKHQPVNSYVAVVGIIPLGSSLALSVLDDASQLSYPIALSLALLMYLIFRLPHSLGLGTKSTMAMKFSSSIASFSFSLYVLHLPLLVFLHAFVYRIHPAKWQPTVPNIFLGFSIAACVIVYSWIISRFTEANTARFRRYVRHWLESRRRKTRAKENLFR